MRRAAKVDGNHREIVNALRQVGASVLDLSRVGQGCPDLLVGHRGRAVLMEVKLPNGKLSPIQRDFRNRWQGEVVVVRSVDEALVWAGVAPSSITPNA